MDRTIHRRVPVTRSDGGGDPVPGPVPQRRPFVPADELRAIVAGGPRIDLDELHADLDAVASPSPDPR